MQASEITFEKLAEREAVLKEVERQKRHAKTPPKFVHPKLRRIRTQQECLEGLLKDTNRNERGCILIHTCINPKGYSQRRFGGEHGAHRISWIFHGNSIPEGMNVCHKCDVPNCINPEHLFLGTQKDNLRDMISKNRGWQPHGESHPKAKLTEEQVRHIKKTTSVRDSRGRIPRGMLVDLAELYGVRKENIGKIAHGTYWKKIIA